MSNRIIKELAEVTDLKDVKINEVIRLLNDLEKRVGHASERV